MQELIVKIFSIYLAGITGLYKGVPLGFVLKVSPVLTALFTALGSVTIVLTIFFSGEPFKKWIIKRYGKKNVEKKSSLFSRIMKKYGMAGLGIIAPGLIGPILSMILGIILIKKTKFFLIYLISGIFLWSIILTTVGYFSIDLLKNFL